MMKKILITVGFCLAICTAANGQDCTIPLAIEMIEQVEQFPEASVQYLKNSLTRIAAQDLPTTDLNTSQFFLTAKVDVIDKEILPGPPQQIAQKLGITLYIGDLYNQRIFSTQYIEVSGVGKNEIKTWDNAFRQVTTNKIQVRQLMEEGRKKIINYYDTNYPSLLKQAKNEAAQQNFEQALALANAIPPCCKGYDQAEKVGLSIYKENLNRIGIDLLNKAQAIWGSGQDQVAAEKAMDYLIAIDPQSKSYNAAQALIKKISNQMRSDTDFEKRTKYKDQIKLKSDSISAWRAVGVAYGQGQKPTTTYINWIK